MEPSKKGILLEVGTNEVEFLLFRLGKQRYGINVSKVRQILLFDRTKVAEVPNQPKSIIGVITFRDQSISIIDLRIQLNIEHTINEHSRDLLLVTEFNNRTTAFVVDGVEHIERTNWNEFEPIVNTSCNKSDASVVGTLTLKDGIVIILDLETIMARLDPSMAMDHYETQIGPSTIERDKVNIIHCDDSSVIQKMVLKVLEKAGFRNFHTFSTGSEGYEFLKSYAPEKVDIIISDIEMPKMDGLTFCKKVRDVKGYDKIPFVFFSSMIDEHMERKCKSVGGDACYSKPQIHEIVNGLEQLIIKKRKS